MYFFQYFYIFVIMCLFCKGALETTWLERRRSIWWPTPAPSRSATQPISHFSPEREVSGRKTCSSSRNIISPYFCKKSTSRDISRHLEFCSDANHGSFCLSCPSFQRHGSSRGDVSGRAVASSLQDLQWNSTWPWRELRTVKHVKHVKHVRHRKRNLWNIGHDDERWKIYEYLGSI